MRGKTLGSGVRSWDEKKLVCGEAINASSESNYVLMASSWDMRRRIPVITIQTKGFLLLRILLTIFNTFNTILHGGADISRILLRS